MLMQAYGDDCMSQKHYHDCFTHLKVGRTSTNENQRFDRPSKSISDH